MFISLIVMLSIWGISWGIGKYILTTCGKVYAGILALILAFMGAVVQVFLSVTANESSGLQVDPGSYISNAFLTFFILIYAVYTTLRPVRIDGEKLKRVGNERTDQPIKEETIRREIYEKAWEEIESGNTNKGLWSQCFAKNEGNIEKVKVGYITLRVSELLEERIQETAQQEKERLEICTKAKCEQVASERNMQISPSIEGWEIRDSSGLKLNYQKLVTIFDVSDWMSKYDPDTIDDFNGDGLTKLIEACEQGDVSEVTLLVALGANVRKKVIGNIYGDPLMFTSRVKSFSEDHRVIYDILVKAS